MQEACQQYQLPNNYNFAPISLLIKKHLRGEIYRDRYFLSITNKNGEGVKPSPIFLIMQS